MTLHSKNNQANKNRYNISILFGITYLVFVINFTAYGQCPSDVICTTTFDGQSNSDNATNYARWLAAINDGGSVDYYNDFESYSGNVESTSFPKGLSITNTPGTAEVVTMSFGSATSGSKGLRAYDNETTIFNFSSSPINYFSIYMTDIDQAASPTKKVDVRVYYSNGTNETFTSDQTVGGSNDDEFIGIISWCETIDRVEIQPDKGSEHGFDDLRYGNSCEPATCFIGVHHVTPTVCGTSGNDHVYDLEVGVTYGNSPGGNILVNGTAFASNGSGYQVFTLSNVVIPKGGPSTPDVTVQFASSPSCSQTVKSGYMEPAFVKFGIPTITNCYNSGGTDLFDFTVEITYNTPIVYTNSSRGLYIDGSKYNIDLSGQETLTFTGYTANGSNISIDAEWVGYSGASCDHTLSFTAPNGCSEICSNGSDDDGDGLTDCLDPDCTGGTYISEANLSLAGSSGTTKYYKSDGTVGTSSNKNLTISASSTTLWGYNDYFSTYGINGSVHNSDPNDPPPNFEGLIIGANNETGTVTFTFEQPTDQFYFSFKWLSEQISGEYTSPNLPDGDEWLDNFTADQPITLNFTPYSSTLDTDGDGNADGNTTSWNGSKIQTFYADGRGNVHITANGSPFSTLSFTHTQVDDPYGFVITEISYCVGEICGNGVDNDGDGLIDCADPDCACLDVDVCYIIADGEGDDADTMYTVNPITGAQTVIGSTGLYDVEAMAIDAANNIIYATSDDTLVTINAATGAYTFISKIGSLNGVDGSENMGDIDGLTYDAVNNILWASERNGSGSDGDDDYIFQIDPSTGNPILNAFGAGVDYLEVNTPEDDLDDIAIAPNGTLYAISNDGGSGNQRLIIINKTNGTWTDVGNYGLQDVEGLTFTNANQMMATTGDGGSNDDEIHSIDATTAQSNFIAHFATARDVEACACSHSSFINNAIGNFVWGDIDSDGIQDVGEPGVANVQLNLLDNLGNPVMNGGSPVTTTTDANGLYYFSGLADGSYIVEVVLPGGASIAPQDAGADDDLDSDVNTGNNRTGVITVSGGQIIDNVDIGLLNAVTGVRTCNDAGELFVTDEAGQIGRYDPVTGAVIQADFIVGLDDPHDMVVGTDNLLYVTDEDDDEILRYNLTTGALVSVFATSDLDEPSGMTIGPNGHLYVNNRNDDEVKYYNTTTGALIGDFVTTGSGGLDGNYGGIEFGPDGNLYVTSGNTDEVLRYNGTTGAFIDAFVSAGSGGLNDPRDLTFGPDGNLYVVARSSEKVYRYNGTTGAFIDEFVDNSNSILDAPTHLVFGPDGYLYVTNTDSPEEVIRYNATTGDYVSTLTSGLDNPKGILFAPVPGCPEICNNGLDDDLDGLDDCNDTDCDYCGSICNALNSNPSLEDFGALAFNTTYNGLPAVLIDETPNQIPSWTGYYYYSGSGTPTSEFYYVNDVNDQVNNTEGDKFMVIGADGYCFQASAPMTAGQCYEIVFDASFFTTGSTSISTEMRIDYNPLSNSGYPTQISQETLPINSGLNNSMTWTTFTVPFTPTTNDTYRIFFTLNNTSGAFTGGVALDNVIIRECCVPEEICNNGIDDNGDGLIDEYDPQCACTGRVDADLIALYEFQEGSGNTVYDISGVGSPLDLTIQNPAQATWLPGGGLSISNTSAQSSAAGSKITSAIQASNKITIEAWLRPKNLYQGGPGRIMTLSQDQSNRNFTFGQAGSNYVTRFRTDDGSISDNGTPDFTGGAADSMGIRHVIYTWDGSTNIEKMYIDGVEVSSSTRNGTTSNWNSAYKFGIGNEFIDTRYWNGDIFLAAIYDDVLTPAEIIQNFEQGPVCNDNIDVEVSCSDTREVELAWDGLQNDIPKTFNFTDVGSIDSIVVEIMYHSSSPGSSITVTDAGSNTYTANRETITGGGYFYRVTVPATSSITYSNTSSAGAAQSLLAFVYRDNGSGNHVTAVQPTLLFGYNSTNALYFHLPPRTTPNDITIRLPITELTYDDRELHFRAQTATVSTTNTKAWGPSNSNFPTGCCVDTVELVLPNVPINETYVTILIHSPNITGQSYFVAGTVTADVSCATEDCTNGIDDDGDGLIDCLDPDCSIVNISNVSIGSCIDQPYADVAQLDVTVSWSTAPTDTIEVTIAGKTEYIDVASSISPVTVSFMVPADGSTNNSITTKFHDKICTTGSTYNAPSACSSDQLNCSILYICGDSKGSDADAFDHGLMAYIDGINGSATLDGALAKNEAGMGLYDPVNTSTPLSITLTDYDMIIVSSTTWGDLSSTLKNALKDTEANILLMLHDALVDLGMSSNGWTATQTHAYSDNSTQVQLYNFNNYDPHWDELIGVSNYFSSTADAYLWKDAFNQGSNIQGVFFHYDASDNLSGVAASHGARTFLGYYMDGVYWNDDTNNGATPVPQSDWFDPIRHLTQEGKLYLDQAIELATTGCASEICDDGIDNDGDGLIDCADPDCYLVANTGGTDSDGDGYDDNCDQDDDNDGILDIVEDTCGIGFFDDFGTGMTEVTTPYISNDYTFDNVQTDDGEYTIATTGRPGAASNSNWSTEPDHTPGDADGRMLLINASFTPGEFYRRSYAGFAPNTPITFSFWTRNILIPSNPRPLKPNITYKIEDNNGNVLFTANTGDLQEADGWQNFIGDFTTSETTVFFVLVNNSTGGSGNDLAIDDISFKQIGICDYDNDGIINSFDTDSDDDGCLDALEGSGNISSANLVGGRIGGTIDANGVPVLATGGQGLGASQDENTTAGCDEVCNNGQDDDGDGLIDCADPDCAPIISNVVVTQPTCANKTSGQIVITASSSGSLEYSITNETSWQTSNTFSNLGIGQYTIRVRNDSGCIVEYTSNPVILDFGNCIEICNNGIDDDGDGKIDCDDPDCEDVGTGTKINN